MNGTPRRGPEPAELAELARLLPPPGDPELSDGRHHLLKEHLMLQIEEPATAPRRPKRRRLVLLSAPLAAATVAAGLFTGLPGGGDTPPSPAAESAAKPGGEGAAVLLDRISLAAAHRPALPVRENQFVYIKSKVAWTTQTNDGPRVPQPLREREIWKPQRPGKRGLVREAGWAKAIALVGSKDDLTYRKLAAMTTEPGALLAGVYAKIPKSGKTADPAARNAAAFHELGRLLAEQVLPPKLAAAVYRAAAKIPGVLVVPDSVDAAGRHGVAVALVAYGERSEWIFDKKTLNYLGERGYMVADTKLAKKGTITATTAVLQRGVVNKSGELPGRP